jgi:hypothetical protein
MILPYKCDMISKNNPVNFTKNEEIYTVNVTNRCVMFDRDIVNELIRLQLPMEKIIRS